LELNVDTGTWLSYIEENCYHPIIAEMVKTLRREDRNDIVVDRFISFAILRKKRQIMNTWKEEGMRNFHIPLVLSVTIELFVPAISVRKIKRLRQYIVAASLKWRNNYCGRAFDT
jgi:hypothetical protein